MNEVDQFCVKSSFVSNNEDKLILSHPSNSLYHSPYSPEQDSNLLVRISSSLNED